MAVCKTIDAKLNLKILPAFEMPVEEYTGEFTVYHRFEDIPSLGYTQEKLQELSPKFAVIDRKAPFQPCLYHGLRGGLDVTYVHVDATLNLEAIEFRPGGEYTDGTIIIGEIMSTIPTKQSERIVRTFRTAMQKQFGKKACGKWWVGPEAYDRLKADSRLTFNYDNPEHGDIQLTHFEPKEGSS